MINQSKSDLERAFDTQLRVLGYDLPLPEPDYKFHPSRNWAVDRAWPDLKIAVEIEGGGHGMRVKCHNCGVNVRARKGDGSLGREIRIGGWHARRTRYLADVEKYNSLSALGWLLFRFTNEDIIGNPFDMVDQIREAIVYKMPSIKLVEELTPREMEVLYLIAAGFRSREIAERLGVKINAVRTYAQELCQKLNVRTRAAAIARASAWKMIDLTEIPWIAEPDEFFAEIE